MTAIPSLMVFKTTPIRQAKRSGWARARALASGSLCGLGLLFLGHLLHLRADNLHALAGVGHALAAAGCGVNQLLEVSRELRCECRAGFAQERLDLREHTVVLAVAFRKHIQADGAAVDQRR